MKMFNKLILFVLLAVASSTVLAHGGHHVSTTASGFINGFIHPFFGADHIIAMVAVGLWGAFLGKPAIWILPIVFPLVMAFGGILGIAGIHLPFVDQAIYLSAVVLGAMVCFAVRPKLQIAALIVGIFAIFHGFSHGVSLHHVEEALPYCLGFVVSTGLLHLAGIGLGAMIKWPLGRKITQAIGALIGLIGLASLVGI